MALAHHHGEASGEEGADQRGPRSPSWPASRSPQEAPYLQGKCLGVRASGKTWSQVRLGLQPGQEFRDNREANRGTAGLPSDGDRGDPGLGPATWGPYLRRRPALGVPHSCVPRPREPPLAPLGVRPGVHPGALFALASCAGPMKGPARADRRSVRFPPGMTVRD
jgi:hypothetical protein